MIIINLKKLLKSVWNDPDFRWLAMLGAVASSPVLMAMISLYFQGLFK